MVMGKGASASEILNRSLIRTGSRVAAAVSGGADSVSLLLALHEVRVVWGIGVSAVHLHHGIRGLEADGDREFVRELCGRLDVPLRIEEADVPAAAAADRETLEEAARNARLRLFRAVITAGEADVVATAHTEDDQAETVLMKLIRGAWTEGIGGISPVLEIRGDAGTVVGSVVRPMLHVGRGRIVEFLKEHGQVWREDSTNTSEEYTRNRVRHRLLPLLREFNPQIAGALASTAELAREEEARWQGEIARVLPQVVLPGKPVRGGGRAVGTLPEEKAVAIEVERLRGMDLPLRRRVLRGAAAGLGCRLSAAETGRLLAMCGLQPAAAAPDGTVSSKPGAKLSLPGGLRAERSARELRLHREQD